MAASLKAMAIDRRTIAAWWRLRPSQSDPQTARLGPAGRGSGMDYINLPIEPKNMEPEDAMSSCALWASTKASRF